VGALAGFGFLVNLGLFTAFARMSIGLALLAFYTYPALLALVGVIALHEPLDRRRGAALLLALGGMTLVVLGGLDPAGGLRLDPLGLVFAVGAGAAQASFALLTRHGFRSLPSEHATTGILTWIALAYALVALVTGPAGDLLAPLASSRLLGLSLFAGIVTAALSTFLFMSGIRLIGPLRAGIGSLFEPVVGIVAAAIVLGEALTPIEGLGGALVLGAVALLQRSGTTAGGSVEA
jgi:drug/metabolite transporter (DMT)-like permease